MTAPYSAVRSTGVTELTIGGQAPENPDGRGT